LAVSFAAQLLVAIGLLHPAAGQEQAATEAPAKTQQDQQYGSVEERRIMESLQAGGASPFARERDELDNKKKELKRLESEVDKKIEQLNQLRVRIEKLLEQKDAEEQKRTLELAKMYEKMTADKAAMVLGTVDQELAISILAKMKTKSAAKILSNMERDKAAKLTTAFSTLDTR
jgi:flagellar motility protein MotE (MotC chaperone)